MEQVLVVKREKIEKFIAGKNGLITENVPELLEIGDTVSGILFGGDDK